MHIYFLNIRALLILWGSKLTLNQNTKLVFIEYTQSKLYDNYFSIYIT